MASDSADNSRLVGANDSHKQRLANLPKDRKLEVVRVQYLGRDLDSKLRALGFPVQDIPVLVPLGGSLFDLVVAEEQLERFNASLQPALTGDNEERNSTELFRQERLTDNDPLVQLWGKAEATRKTLKEFENHLPTCWENVRPWLAREIESLKVIVRQQNGLDILSSETRMKLDPEYLSFHDEYGQGIPEAKIEEDLARLRSQPSWFAAGDLPQVKVGDIHDILIEQGGIEIRITVILPIQSLQGKKRPSMVWFHGGGLVLGNSRSELGPLTIICREVGCVIFSVDYRLAPEHRFPAAPDDGMAALEWVRTKGVELYNMDINRIAVGGVSAGGNLAAVTALKDAEMNAVQPLVFQLLIVPLLDNGATVESIGRKANCDAPGLISGRLLEFQRLYLLKPEDGTRWEASPIRIPVATLKKWPVARAYIAVAEVDPLCYEGLKFGRVLGRAGVATTVNTLKGAPHMIMNLGGVMEQSRQLLRQLISYMAEQFGGPLEAAQS